MTPAAIELEAELLEDDWHRAEWSIECKRQGYGYGPGSSTKAEDARYLRELQRRATDARRRADELLTESELRLLDGNR